MARRRNNESEHVEGEEGESTERVAPRNSAARAQIIREACETIAEYDRQIAGIKAEKKAVIETRIVADLGMKKGDFALAYKLYEVSQEDRDTLFDTMRECFRALGIGEQMDWLAAADAAA